MIRWAAVAIAIIAAPVAGQESPPTFRARTELIRVNILVTDGRRPISGLTVDDFELRDSGVQQRIDRVVIDDSPLDTWLVLDESGSVKGDLDALVKAAGALADAHGSHDRTGLITLRHTVAVQSDLTNTRTLLKPQFAAASAQGYTSLRDALFVALALREENVERSLVVVFTDGQDTMSWLTQRQLVEAVRLSDVVIYAVGANNAAAFGGDDGLAVSWRGRGDLLRELVNQTGGRRLTVGADLARAFTEIVQEMKARYLLTYYPSGVNRSGWHPIDVRLTRRRAHIQARRGYLVNER